MIRQLLHQYTYMIFPALALYRIAVTITLISAFPDKKETDTTKQCCTFRNAGAHVKPLKQIKLSPASRGRVFILKPLIKHETVNIY